MGFLRQCEDLWSVHSPLLQCLEQVVKAGRGRGNVLLGQGQFPGAEHSCVSLLYCKPGVQFE